MYTPKIKSRVEPEIPGKNIAEIAIIPIKNSLIAFPSWKWLRSIEEVPALPFNQVIPATNTIPRIRNKIPLPNCLKPSLSSRIISGIAPAINPINRELTT